MTLSWLRALRQRGKKTARHETNTSRFRNRTRPRLERLEDRTVPVICTVSRLDDAMAENTLRWCIDQVNRSGPADDNEINFAMAGGTILLTSALDPLSRNVDIRGPLGLINVSRSDAAGTPNFRIFDIAATSRASFVSLRISNGVAEGSGGGIRNRGTLTLTYVDLYDNVAEVDGGGVVNDGGELTLQEVHIFDNIAVRHGGGVYNAGRMYIQYNSYIFANYAWRDGGGIYNFDTLLIGDDSQISTNLAGEKGGGIYNLGNMAMDSGAIVGNEATDDGGGVYNNVGTAELSNVRVESNSARRGGGVFVFTGSVTFSSCTIRNNTARVLGPGGAWAAGSSLVFSECTILDDVVPVP